ncbi:MAG TPA: 1,4-alpha-glucan branching enzyme, partial [Isosphaeraceae bacterium]
MATTQAATASREDIDRIIHADHWDPFQVLGQHETAVDRKPARVVRAFLPHAAKAWVVDLSGGEPGTQATMERVHDDGFFEAVFPGRAKHFPYRLAVENHEGHAWEFVDPYQFGPVLTDFDLHLLGEGTHLRNFEKLGAHLIDHEGIRGVHFSVWAPNARRVSVIGNFNHWDGRIHPMRSRGSGG